MNLIFFLFAAPEDEHFEVKMRHFSQNASRCGAEEIRMCLIMTTFKVITLQWNTRICMINILAKRQRKLKQSRQSANTFVFTSVFFDIAFYQMQRRDHCEIYFPLIFSTHKVEVWAITVQLSRWTTSALIPAALLLCTAPWPDRLSQCDGARVGATSERCLEVHTWASHSRHLTTEDRRGPIWV